MKKIIVGMSGASGQIYGIRLLQTLRQLENVEVHLIRTEWAKKTAGMETKWQADEIASLADRVYDCEDLAAPVSSGSFQRDAMIIVPCSVKTLSAIANSYNDNLLVRAADTTLKEHKTLILSLRETPLHRGHIRLMAQAAEAGAIIAPPVPMFYTLPQTIDDLVDQTVYRLLDLVGIPVAKAKRWSGGAECK
ncbi:MAG: UbiX family flavin prenyltransferase [Peptococcaceae bacterium]|nr:UbiX family flavin prenyltransferase [Peptococcaceae bacterium]